VIADRWEPSRELPDRDERASLARRFPLPAKKALRIGQILCYKKGSLPIRRAVHLQPDGDLDRTKLANERISDPASQKDHASCETAYSI